MSTTSSTATPTDQTSAEPSEAMLRRVQGLLAKASDDAATPAESETYMAKATELMAKYGIQQAMLDAAKPAGQRETVTHKRIVIEGPYATQKQNLLGWLAKPLRCQAVWHTGRGRETAITLFGYPSDLAQVETLYASLLLQAIRDVLNEHVPYYENKAAYRRSFLEGFAAEVSDRVKAIYQRVETTDEPGTALVLVDRSKAVTSAVDEMFPKLRSGRRSRLSGGGHGDGRRSAQRADIGQRAAGGGRTAIGR